MIKSPTRSECYTILESTGIIEQQPLWVLTSPILPGSDWQITIICVWPNESKGVKIPFCKYTRAKFLDCPGARDVQRVGDPGRARLEPKRRVKWRTVTMREMLEAGVHFGHRTRFWSPKMSPYIFGSRNKIHIINLEKTLPLYTEAVNFLGKIASQKGVILFVGTKRQAGDAIREQAERCGSPYVNHRWLGGMLTNYQTIKNSITRLIELEELTQGGGTGRVSKKENLQLERQKSKLERSLSGIRNMKGTARCDVRHRCR